MGKLAAQQIASYLSRFPIAAELPWSVGQRELIVLRGQDFNSFVKESFVERTIDGQTTWVKQRDYSRIAESANSLVLSEAAFFERLNWHKASFYGLKLPNPAGRPSAQDWTKEQRNQIKWAARLLKAGLKSQAPPDIQLAARRVNYAERKKLRGKVEIEYASAIKEKLAAAPEMIYVYRNDELNPFSDLPFTFA